MKNVSDKIKSKGKLSIAMVMVFCVTTALSVQAATYPSGMISYWELNEGSGTDALDTVDSNDGTISGATWTSDGRAQNALDFDGVNDYVTIPDAANLDFTQHTIELWVKPDQDLTYTGQVADIQQWIDKIDDSGIPSNRTGWNFVYATHTVGGPHVNFHSGSGADILECAYNFYSGEWYYLVHTYDGTTRRLYVNGIECASKTATATSNWISSESLIIGGEWSNSQSQWQRFVDGVIDEVAVYSRALTAEEIMNHYKKGLDGKGYASVSPPIAIASTSLDASGNQQLDGSLSIDQDGDDLTYSWYIEGETTARTGETVSVTDLDSGTYRVVLSVSDGTYTDSDTFLLAIP